jgi:hypothetical protein
MIVSYHDYLQSDGWKARVQQMLAKADYQCTGKVYHPQHVAVRCNNTHRLQVHHRTYERLGQEREDDLQVLCERCHLLAHVQVPDCHRCGNPLLEDHEIQEFVDNELAWNPESALADIDLTELVGFPLCSWCDHMMTKEC